MLAAYRAHMDDYFKESLKVDDNYMPIVEKEIDVRLPQKRRHQMKFLDPKNFIMNVAMDASKKDAHYEYFSIS